ncbi:MAG: tetratricopeptide repeat protein [Candidatus Hydrogenedens sp.]|nr:tetratricopeptide repeat protein [Candidatus Hydrogenedens sp.]
MTHPVFQDETKMLIRWGGLLLVLAVAALGVNIGTHQHVQDLRASSPWTYVKAGQARMAANDPDGALLQFRKAAALDDRSPLAWEHMGLLYYEREEFAKAAEAYEAARKRGSIDPDARGKALWAYIHTKRYDEAIALGEQSMRDGHATPQFARWVGDANFRAGRYNECIPHFEQALKNQEDLYVMSKLLGAYEHTGRTKQAEALRERIEVLEAS